jgi:DNA repair exonuclease SbcCD ATPase subunit
VTRKGKLDSKGAYKTEERTLHVNGNEVNLESDEDLRGKITELLGASFRKFVNLVYVRQGKLTTILEPQKDQMDSVIGITLLRELREQLDGAREELEKYEGKDTATEAQNLEQLVIPDLCSNVDQLRKDVEQLTGEAQSLDELVKKGESPELTRLLGQIEQKENSESDIRDLRAKIRELLSILGTKYAVIRSPDELEPEMKAWGRQLRNLEQKQTALDEKVNSLLDSWYTIRGRADSLESQIEEHEALLRKKISKCPTCGQDLKPKIMRSVLKADKTQLRKLRREERDAKESYETKKTKLDDLNTKVTHAELKGKVTFLTCGKHVFDSHWIEEWHKLSCMRLKVV